MKKEAKAFFQNACIMALVALVARSVMVYFQAYLSRAVGAEGMGLVGLIGTVFGFATTFAISGVPLAVTRLVSASISRGDSVGALRALRNATLYALFFSSLASVFLLLCAGWIGRDWLGDERTIAAIKVLSLSLIPLSLASVISGYFTAVGRVTGSSLTQLVELLVRIGATVVIVKYLPMGDITKKVGAVMLGITISQLFSALALGVEYWLDKKRHLPPLVSLPQEAGGMRALCHIAMPLALSTYVRSGLLTLEHILIPICLAKGGASHSDSLAAYGTLQGMALPVVLYPMGILSAASPLLVPLFSTHEAKGENGQIHTLASRALHIICLLGLGCFTCLFIFSEELGLVLFDSREAAGYIRPLSFVLPLMFLDHVTDGILKGIGEQVYTMWVNILDAILSILLVLLLLPHFGAMGYVYVILLAEIFNLALSLSRLVHKVRPRFSPMRSLVLPVLAGGLSALLVSKLLPIPPEDSSLIWLLVRLLFTAVVYAGVLLVAKLSRGHDKSRQAT